MNVRYEGSRETERKTERERERDRDGVGTGWRRPIGCLQLHVISRKKANNHRALLQKMTEKSKGSDGSSPLCIIVQGGVES